MRHLSRVLAVLLACAGGASASTIAYRTDAELVAIADRVVRARVLDTTVVVADDGRIRTRTRLAVVEDFTGGADAVIVVEEPGGRLPDGRELWIPGVPRFTTGDDVVLCLERRRGAYRTVAFGFSAFHVRGGGGTITLQRFSGPVTVVGAAPGGDRVRTLEAFRAAAATVTGVRARAVLTPEQADAEVTAATPSRVDEPYTLLGGGLRWRQADSGVPIAWYRNTLTPSPVQGGDTDAEIGLALLAWTAPQNASITLTFGGTRLEAMGPPSNPYCTAGNLGAGLITFGDPLDELPVGVLAIGGGCTSSETHVVNSRVFRAFTHGLIVFNDDAALQGFRTPPNITRIMQHELGHTIGLGHTCEFDTCTGSEAINIMYPGCCPPGMPLPPALGPDDLAGLVFIYPPCDVTVGPPSSLFVPTIGGRESVTVAVSRAECGWSAVPDRPWMQIVSGGSGTGNGTVTFFVTPNLANPAERTGSLAIRDRSATITQAGDIDLNGDGIYEQWLSFFRLDVLTPGQTGPGDDADGDGITNLAEQAAGTHPHGVVRRYLAEGVSNAFFDTDLALFAPGDNFASVVFRFQPEGAPERTLTMLAPLYGRRTVTASQIESMTTAPFATLIESDFPVVVDRTVRWDATGYGAHGETAVDAPATTWYLAEGSTSGDFELFYLLQNPGDAAVSATVRFLRPAPLPPVSRTYTLAPRARLTIPVDGIPDLASTDVSGVVTATLPIVVERAMYLNRPGQPFAAGHGSAGIATPATSWFLAEGATGSFFELFVLIANPSAQAAAVRVDYLLPGGGTLSKAYAIAPESRFTIWVDDEQLPAGSGQRPLASTAVAMRVTSTNAVPIIVERSMWWPQPLWYEAHNAPGTTVTGTRWALAEGFVGGPKQAETYVLIANTSAAAGTARVILYGENGMLGFRDVALAPESRTNVAISSFFPGAIGQPFSTIVESMGASPVPIVVERAMYESPGGVTWAAGTSVVATRLTP
jgi:hypothetical protein